MGEVSEKLAKPLDISVIRLPKARMLSSYLKSNTVSSDIAAFLRYLQMNGIKSGNHERFEFERDGHGVIIVKIPDSYANDSGFVDITFEGGYFAAANVYLDDDLSATFRSVVKSFDDNKYYQIDYSSDG